MKVILFVNSCIYCLGLCANPKDRKAIGHITHGQSPAHETDKKTVNLDPNKDLDGNNKPQNAVMYNNAHDVNSTPDISKATQEINSNSHIKNTLLQHEDKK